MPISLGPETQAPKWSKLILGLLWFFQFVTLGIFQLITMFLVYAMIAGNAHRVVHWYFTTMMVFILIVNALTLCTILYEMYQFGGHIKKESAQRYFKIQVVKSFYFLLLVIVTLVSGSGLPMDGNMRGAAWVWGTIWRMSFFVGPFWLSLVYAFVVKRKAANAFGEGGEVAL